MADETDLERPRGDVLVGSADRSRKKLLIPLYRRLLRRIEVAADAARNVESETAESLAPHPQLRQRLQQDPAMAALLPGAACRFALGGVHDAPFTVAEPGLILLPPALLDDVAALAAAARWGLEVAHALEDGSAQGARFDSALRHGAALIAGLPQGSRQLLLDLLLEPHARAMVGLESGGPVEAELVAWLAERVVGWRPMLAPPQDVCELEMPLERILVAGGDSRLGLDPATGQNRYGVPPRPRPEAVHFSSSTASAISDHGFLYCDLLRRDLLRAHRLNAVPIEELRHRLANATGLEILRLLGLGREDADVGVAASGTDAELLAVLVACAGAGGRPLTSLLIAPDESGRGILLAAGGRYFDDLTSTGRRVIAGSAACPGCEITVRVVEIRDAGVAPRTVEAIDADFLALGRDALEAGQHVLAHVILASKTGLSAPSDDAIEALVALAPDRVDVVVDACQMRTPFVELGSHVRRGRMLQVSGSKFLTGPPFSGALVVPKSLRHRACTVGRQLAVAPAVGSVSDWTEPWSRSMVQEMAPQPSFGMLFRWLPALLEAELLQALPQGFRSAAFDRFRHALQQRLLRSPFVRPIDVGDGDVESGHSGAALARLSILSFEVLGVRSDGRREALGSVACRRLFELLNADVTALLAPLDALAAATARQSAHIGQPVTLRGAFGDVTVLRMVLGARFFNIVGYAGRGSFEAALRSEIADAERAVAKVELLASQWWRLEGFGEQGR